MLGRVNCPRRLIAGVVAVFLAGVGGLSARAHGLAGTDRMSVHSLTLVSIPSPDRYIDSPGIFGATVIWGGEHQDRNGHFVGTVYTATTGTRRARVVARAAFSMPQLNHLRISARWLSWIEYNTGSSQWRLMAEDRHHGQPFVVDSSAIKGGSFLTGPYLPLSALDGSTLVWSFSVVPPVGKPWMGVRVRTLPNGPTKVLARETWPGCRVTWPAVGGAVAAWDQEGPCSGRNSDVVVANWRTGRNHFITHDHSSSEPATNGQLVAYKGNGLRMGGGNIVLLNLATGRRQVVDRTGGATAPMLTDSVLAWNSDYDSEIVAEDLHTNRRYVLRGSGPKHGYIISYGQLGQGWHNEVVLVRVRGRADGGGVQQSVVIERIP